MRVSNISALLVGLCISTVYANPYIPGKRLAPNHNAHMEDAHTGHDYHEHHEGGTRIHSRDLNQRSTVQTVNVPLGTVNTTTTASLQAFSVKDGAVIFAWIDDKPEFLIAAHLASSDIADGLTKIKTAAKGKGVDRAVVEVPDSKQGRTDFHTIKADLKEWTKTKPQHREFKEGKTYDFWATAGKKGEVGMKSA